jgi:hypothetical protein
MTLTVVGVVPLSHVHYTDKGHLLNKFFLTYETEARWFKFIVHADIQGTTVPLIRASSIEASEKFIQQAQTWSNWDWMLKLMHPTMQIRQLHNRLLGMNPRPDYDRDKSEYCAIKVSDITAPVSYFSCPDDSVSLDDWADSIFFSEDISMELVKPVSLMEYHSRVKWTPSLGPPGPIS